MSDTIENKAVKLSDLTSVTQLIKDYTDEKDTNKVDKIEGKSLLDDTEIERLKGVNNYDDTEVKENIAEVKTDVTKLSSQIDENVNLINARMDTFTTLAEGSTTGDAELKDIRVGADGTTYENAGTAVREQISHIYGRTNNMFNYLTATYGYYIDVANGKALQATKEGYYVSDYIEIEGGEQYYLSANKTYAFYDSDKVKITTGGSIGNTSEIGILKTPDNAKYIRFTIYINLEVILSKGSTKAEYVDYYVLQTDLKDMINKISEKETKIRDIISKIILSEKVINIKILGDSITAGVGGTGYELTGELIYGTNRVNENGVCWANKLKEHFENKFNCSVKNYGVAGITSKDIIDNWTNIVKENDDILVCTIGTNDRSARTLSEFLHNIETIYLLAKQSGKDIILIANIPASVSNESNSTRKFHMEDIDNVYCYLSSKYNFEYISLYKKFVEYCTLKEISIDSLLADGLHPNDDGYNVMFYLICNAMGIATKRIDATW